MNGKEIWFALMIVAASIRACDGQEPGGTPGADRLIIPGDQLSTIQRVLDYQAAHGYKIASISYKSSIRNLHRKGQLEIELERTETPARYEYRALTTRFETGELEKSLNEGGARGFQLLKQTPIPIELGVLRTRDMFFVILNKPADGTVHYSYRVLAYRHRSYAQNQIEQARREGFSEVSRPQFGPVFYVVMEKTILATP